MVILFITRNKVSFEICIRHWLIGYLLFLVMYFIYLLFIILLWRGLLPCMSVKAIFPCAVNDFAHASLLFLLSLSSRGFVFICVFLLFFNECAERRMKQR